MDQNLPPLGRLGRRVIAATVCIGEKFVFQHFFHFKIYYVQNLITNEKDKIQIHIVPTVSKKQGKFVKDSFG